MTKEEKNKEIMRLLDLHPEMISTVYKMLKEGLAQEGGETADERRKGSPAAG